MKRAKRQQQGVQGVEIGLRIAYALANATGPMALRDLARATQLAPSKVHRYLVSLCRAGVVEQDGMDGRYDLGQGAIVLGLSALSRLDEFRLANRAIEDLHNTVGLAVSLMSWGSHGPTIIRRIDTVRPVIATTRIGTVISVTTSASGRLFAAFLPKELVDPIVNAEFSSSTRPTSMGKPISRREFEKIVGNVRRKRLASVRGDFLAGFDALSAPVFDQQGDIAMTISVLAPTRMIDLSFNGKTATALSSTARSLSARLGYSEAAHSSKSLR
jgi:DNA-binding IclR family transcriptional regulator